MHKAKKGKTLTIRTRRRGRRSLAAILAAMLMASVLAVVAGAPAQAANTASEHKVDTDGDKVPDAREFAGAHFYDTSLLLANRYMKEQGGEGSVNTVILAAGATMVDAVTAAGLSDLYSAPILVTQSDGLTRGIAKYIEDNDVNSFIVVGGPDVVPDSLVEDVEALDSKPKLLKRLAGNNRAETAAAIASELGGESRWCGTDIRSAVLVNGDGALIDAISVGPIAAARALPILLTNADMLPEATADVLSDLNIGHVVIVGGEVAVEPAVEDQIKGMNIKVQRIAGDTAAGTSVELTKILLKDCADDLNPSTGQVALVNANAVVDGASAAPVLGRGIDGNGPIPVLVVDRDGLPAEVRDYLAGTANEDSSGNKTHLSIIAVGGDWVVPAAVMTAAVEAAASSAGNLTVAFGAADTTATIVDGRDVNKDGKEDANDAPQPGDTGVILYFSDHVNQTGILAKVRDVLRINGAPASLASSNPVLTGTAGSCTPGGKVRVNLASALKEGDKVEIVSSSLKFGASEDTRDLVAASRTVPKLPVDRTRPVVSLTAFIGQQSFVLDVTDTGGLATTPAQDFTASSTAAQSDEIKLMRGNALVNLGVTAITDNRAVVTFTGALTATDKIVLAKDAVMDKAGNKNQGWTRSPTAAPKSPTITSVTMSNLNHAQRAVWQIPSVFTGGAGTHATLGGSPGTGDAPDMWITAKQGGAADGAAGNVWTFSYDVASTYDAEKAQNISVFVSGTRVHVRFVNGKAKMADLKKALDDHAAFSALFDVSIDADPATVTTTCKAANSDLTIATGTPTSGPVALVKGETKVAVEIKFSGAIRTVDDTGDATKSAHSVLLADVLAATVARMVTANLDVDSSGTVDLDDAREALNLEDTDASTAAQLGPRTMVRYEMSTETAAALPQRRDRVTTAAGSTNDEPTTDFTPPSTGAVAPAARGYAADTASTTTVREDQNGASTRLIGQSSSVKAPS